MNKNEALKMAIEWIENAPFEEGSWSAETKETTLLVIKEALEQPAQEPVAWMSKMGSFTAIAETKKQLPKGTEPIPLYTHPHQWQGLTDDEIDNFGKIHRHGSLQALVSAIEQALKEKNT
jgi:hypothetical protein